MTYLFLKSLHIIAMVAWFAGLFYLPRLFVYHIEASDQISLDRFQKMESRLYYYITWPAALATTLFGLMLILIAPHIYLKSGWMHAKLFFVILLWVFHLSCGRYLKQFLTGKPNKTSRFFRYFNELPTILLIAIVFLVVIKPF